MHESNKLSGPEVRMPDFSGDWRPLAGGGSDRRYSRLASGTGAGMTVIRAEAPDVVENRAFIGLSRVFRKNGVNVPEIYGAETGEKVYYIEDLGDDSLFSHIGSPDFEALAEKALISLVKMQTVDAGEWGNHVMHPAFSSRQARFDLNYFKYSLLKPSGVIFDEEALEDDIERFSEALASLPEPRQGFMFRDFQSRNVMVRDGEPWFIDYQGGRRGPVLYDAVSFLWQAKAALPRDMKERLLNVYSLEYERVTGVKPVDLLSDLPLLVAFRTLQVLGAYGMRGLIQKRAHFLQSLPSGISNLREVVECGMLSRFPELEKACRTLCAMDRFEMPRHISGSLTVRVMSFSYKKGYPDDFTGNGGGFMFDCRAMHNPGRYDEYKALTGRDEPVIRFLEERGEVQKFLGNVWELTDAAVGRYMERGFSSLQIGFGCTGGRHRSVYCAERTARHIKQCFPEADVVLSHREHPDIPDKIIT